MGAVQSVKDPSERPRERLDRLGASAISAGELVAIILGVGMRGLSSIDLAHRLLAQVGGIAELATVSAAELTQCQGIGPARALRLCAAVELGRRTVAQARSREGPVVGPKDVFDRLRIAIGDLQQEVFVTILLDARGRVIQELEIARGSLTGVDVHPREIFRPLVRAGAAAAVVAHNHPSGDPEPSPEDLELTRRIMAAGEILGIPILDHVIVASSGFCSIAERLRP